MISTQQWSGHDMVIIPTTDIPLPSIDFLLFAVVAGFLIPPDL
jgi:hypothetical protein